MRNIFINKQLWLYIFFVRKIAEHFKSSLNGLDNIKIFIIQVEFHLFSFCKVHHIIDEVNDHDRAILSTFKLADWGLYLLSKSINFTQYLVFTFSYCNLIVLYNLVVFLNLRITLYWFHYFYLQQFWNHLKLIILLRIAFLYLHFLLVFNVQ